MFWWGREVVEMSNREIFRVWSSEEEVEIHLVIGM